MSERSASTASRGGSDSTSGSRRGRRTCVPVPARRCSQSRGPPWARTPASASRTAAAPPPARNISSMARRISLSSTAAASWRPASLPAARVMKRCHWRPTHSSMSALLVGG
ncbi:MAG: hypothetical protein U1F21_09450 [Sphaerotilus natans]